MTPEEEKYYNNYFDLFGSEGWQQVMEELKSREDAYEIVGGTGVPNYSTRRTSALASCR